MEKKMSFDFNTEEYLEALLTEWGYRVNDGMPNPNDFGHQMVLRDILTDWDWDMPTINEFITNMKNVNPIDEKIDKVYVQNDKDAPAGAEIETGPKGGHYYKGDPKTGEPAKSDGESGGKDEPKSDSRDNGDQGTDKKHEELTSTDHQKTDSALMMTKEGAKAQAKQTGIKGVGAGTAESRAGEAAVHKTLRLLKSGKSMDEIESELMDIANKKESVLTKEWVTAAIASGKSIESMFGMDNIDEIMWDTPEGNSAINTTGHGTSSDMFVKLKDGTRVGISLKKSGQVFLSNGGYGKVFDTISVELTKGGVSKSDLEEFKKKAGKKSYVADLKKQVNEGASAFAESANSNEILKKLLKDDKYARDTLGPNFEKYRKRIDSEFVNRISGKSGKMNGLDVRTFAKIAQSSSFRETNPEVYNNMRNADARLLSRFLESVKDNPQIEDGFKKHILHGIHIDETLGITPNKSLDKFITVYGIPPDGSKLSEKTLMTIFGNKSKNILEKFRDAPDNEKDKYKKMLMDEIESKLVIDYKDGSRDGSIKIKHEDGTEYPLFKMSARSRGIGASPTMEIVQTTFMANALQYGMDIDQWPPLQEKNFLKKSIAEYKEELKDAAPANAPYIKEKISELKQKLVEIGNK
jgi:hypothetical protein